MFLGLLRGAIRFDLGVSQPMAAVRAGADVDLDFPMTSARQSFEKEYYTVFAAP